MTHPPSKPRPSKASSLDEPYVPGDPIPAPEAIEQDSNTAWAAFSELEERHDARFAPTAPASLPMRLTAEERHFAATVPGSLPQAQGTEAAAAKPAGPAAVTLDQMITEARRNNRVCPKPALWEQLYELLPDKNKRFGRTQPTPPLTGRAWIATPALAKRVAFREHIEWAHAHGALAAVAEFLARLTDQDWHHIGEDTD